MADIKVSGLAAVAAFATTQEFPVNDSGTSKKITGTQLKAAFPQGTLSGGYLQVTANQGGITTIADLTGLAAAVTVGTGRRIRVSFKATVESSVATDIVEVDVREGSTTLDTFYQQLSSASHGVTITGAVILTPTPGAHTYKLSVARTLGTGTLQLDAGVTDLAFILVEDIGT